MSKHTPEPWVIKRYPNKGWGDHYLIVGANYTPNGTKGVIFHEFDHGKELPDWERIVACVNACKGIDDPEELATIAKTQNTLMLMKDRLYARLIYQLRARVAELEEQLKRQSL